MSIKNGVLKMLAKIESINVSTLWGYSLAAFMMVHFLHVSLAQIDVYYGGGEEVIHWTILRIALFWLSALLVAVTKRTKYFGLRLARIFAVVFAFVAARLAELVYLPLRSISYWTLISAVCIIFGVIGYFLGKAIGKKAEKFSSPEVVSHVTKPKKEHAFLAKAKSIFFGCLNDIESVKIRPVIGYFLMAALLALEVVQGVYMTSLGLRLHFFKNATLDEHINPFRLDALWVAVALFAIVKVVKFFRPKTDTLKIRETIENLSLVLLIAINAVATLYFLLYLFPNKRIIFNIPVHVDAFWLAIVLFALTKRSKFLSSNSAMLFAIAFFFIAGQHWRIFPDNYVMNGDCEFVPTDFIWDAVKLVAAYFGYLVGKKIVKKAENYDSSKLEEPLCLEVAEGGSVLAQ